MCLGIPSVHNNHVLVSTEYKGHKNIQLNIITFFDMPHSTGIKFTRIAFKEDIAKTGLTKSIYKHCQSLTNC